MKNIISEIRDLSVFKTIVVIVSVLYLYNPVQLEVKTILHSILHAVEMPNTIISHQNRDTINTFHKEKKHVMILKNHNHSFIDFIGNILNANKSNDDKTGKTILSIYKIKKHLIEYEFLEEKVIFLRKQNLFFQIKNNVNKGYVCVLEKPPKNFNYLQY